jgi:hypothetical protein
MVIGMLIIAIPLLETFDRFNLSTFIPLFFIRSSSFSTFGIVLLNIFYAIQYDALTVIVNTFLLLLIILTKGTRQIILFLVLGLGIFVYLFAILGDEIEEFRTSGPSNFMGNVSQVSSSHPIFSLDANTTWRIIFWYRVLIERYPENLSGVGFGTPLLDDYVPGVSSQAGRDSGKFTYDDEYVAHVIGAHNSYITLFARLGVLYIPILIMTYYSVFNGYFDKRLTKSEKLFYLSFFTISVVALFNLVLETPTVSFLYWVFLGFIANITFNKK